MDNEKKHPLLQRSKDSHDMLEYWNQANDIIEGQKSVKRAGKKYLPKFTDENEDDYKFRLQLSKFTNIFRDTLEGLASKPFEEEITLIGEKDKIPDDIRKFVEDVDGLGNNMTVFAGLTFFNGICNALDWILVDYPTADESVRTLADAKAKNMRPFWSHILASNVLEIRREVIGAKEVISYFRVLEPSPMIGGMDQVRIFERSGDLVTWQLWEKLAVYDKVENSMVLIANGTLAIDEIPVVPFVTGRRDGNGYKFFPPMQDAADLQIVLYQDESALQYIKTLAGYPMLAANNMKPKLKPDGKTTEKIKIGPMCVLYGVPDNNGGAGEFKFIEPNANSMEFLQKNIDRTKQDLRELGRQPLTALSSQLTTVTTSIAAGKAKSAVTTWAYALKDALENALVLTAKWMKISYDPEVNVFTGFDNVLDDGKDLDALATARKERDISRETYLFELKRRGVLSPEFNLESEEQRLMDEIPSEGEDTQLTEGNQT